MPPANPFLTPMTPCPCQSGKRYEICCAREERREELLRMRVAKWLLEPGRKSEVASARQAFRLGQGDRWEKKEDQAGGPDASLVNFDAYLLSEHRMADGRTPIAAFAQDHWLDSRDRAAAERLIQGRRSIYEITAVKPGKSVTMRDVFTLEVFDVRDIAASRGLTRWEFVFTRLLQGRGAWVGDGAVVRIPPDYAARLFEVLATEQMVRGDPEAQRRMAQDPARAYHLIGETLSRPPFDRAVTFEGDAVVITKRSYRTDDVDAALEKLEDVPGFYPGGPDERNRFVINWAEAESTLDARRVGSPPETTGKDRAVRMATYLVTDGTVLPASPEERLVNMGMVVLDHDGTISLECLSQNRMGRLAALVEGAIPGLRFEESSEEEVDLRAMWGDSAEPGANRAQRKDSGAARVVSRALEERSRRALADQFLNEWPDTPVPAFGGKSPREAAQSPEQRAAVVEFLKTIDHAAHQGTGILRPREVSALVRSLGLPPLSREATATA
ncbi:MAG: SEC-C domain-containing protein [Thermoplasmatota archaeon]